MKSEFELDDKGIIITSPLSGWKTATLPQDHILLRLEYVPTREALETDYRPGLQLNMRRSQALALAEALVRTAHTPYLPRA